MSSISGITPSITAEPLVRPNLGSAAGGLGTASTAVSDLQAISSDLQSGDLASAQQTFNSLSQLVGSVSAPGTTPALTALGQALQSGNTTAASQALSSFGKNLVGILQKFAANHASQPGALAQINNLIASLDTIPGVASSTTSVTSNSNNGSAMQSGSNALNVIA